VVCKIYSCNYFVFSDFNPISSANFSLVGCSDLPDYFAEIRQQPVAGSQPQIQNFLAKKSISKHI